MEPNDNLVSIEPQGAIEKYLTHRENEVLY